MADITGSVGEGGDNRPGDVLTVQKLLNQLIDSLRLPRLEEDDLIGIDTIGAIRKYQAEVLGMGRPDGRVDVGGRTWRSLIEGRAPAVPPATESGAKWTWDQSAGTLAWKGKVIGYGYAGRGAGKNNPAMDGVKNTGPIPRGLWRITGKTSSKGPVTIVLEPVKGTQTKGRSAFRIHGDNKTKTASEGCIILGRIFRDKIWANRNDAPLIEVVA